MPPDPLSRAEFDGYVRRHESDVNAHAAFRRVDSEDQAAIEGKLGDRITSLERWQAYIMGALAMLTFLVTGGVVAAVIELLRK